MREINNQTINDIEGIGIVEAIFQNCGFEIRDDSSRKTHTNSMQLDFVATKDSFTYGVEVKKSVRFMVERVVDRMSSYCSDNNYKSVLVVLSRANSRVVDICSKRDIILIDISNLLYAVQKDSALYNKLVSLLSFSVESIKPEKSLLDRGILTQSNEGESLIKELDLIETGKEGFSTFESWCLDSLKFLFSDKLALWASQQKSNDGLYRFDLLCRIKDDEKDTFWRLIENHFDSKYVIFEFKNYSDKITQEQIYSTEKYLYKKALRSVAIMIARNGYDSNSEWAAKGSLRENGKLILLLSSDEVTKMIKIKMSEDSPSEYLLEKLDGLLAELEK